MHLKFLLNVLLWKLVPYLPRLLPIQELNPTNKYSNKKIFSSSCNVEQSKLLILEVEGLGCPSPLAVVFKDKLL